METNAVDKINIPDGTYKGLWSGYTVIIEGFENIEVKTIIGIKGFDIPCTILLNDKEALIKSLL